MADGCQSCRRFAWARQFLMAEREALSSGGQAVLMVDNSAGKERSNRTDGSEH